MPPGFVMLATATTLVALLMRILTAAAVEPWRCIMGLCHSERRSAWELRSGAQTSWPLAVTLIPFQLRQEVGRWLPLAIALCAAFIGQLVSWLGHDVRGEKPLWLILALIVCVYLDYQRSAPGR